MENEAINYLKRLATEVKDKKTVTWQVRKVLNSQNRRFKPKSAL